MTKLYNLVLERGGAGGASVQSWPQGWNANFPFSHFCEVILYCSRILVSARKIVKILRIVQISSENFELFSRNQIFGSYRIYSQRQDIFLMFVWPFRRSNLKPRKLRRTGVNQYKHTEFIVRVCNVKIKTSPNVQCTLYSCGF